MNDRQPPRQGKNLAEKEGKPMGFVDVLLPSETMRACLEQAIPHCIHPSPLHAQLEGSRPIMSDGPALFGGGLGGVSSELHSQGLRRRTMDQHRFNPFFSFTLEFVHISEKGRFVAFNSIFFRANLSTLCET